MLIGRPGDAIAAAITTAVVMLAAAVTPRDAGVRNDQPSIAAMLRWSRGSCLHNSRQTTKSRRS